MTKKTAPTFSRTKTIEYEGAKVTVRCATIMTQVARDGLYERLKDVIKEVAQGYEYLPGYCDVVAQTEEVSGLPFELPAASVEDAAHVDAFQHYSELPLDFVAKWIAACTKINTPEKTNADLQPGVKTDDFLSSKEG